MADIFPTRRVFPNGTFPILPRTADRLRRNLSSAKRHERSSESCLVECIGIEDALNFVDQWKHLASRSLEPNAFLDPSFALPAARHISGGQRPNFLLVWESRASERRQRLIALWPVVAPTDLFGSSLKSWIHDYCCSGAPLLDKDCALSCIEAIFDWMKNDNVQFNALLLPHLREFGPFYVLLQRHIFANGLSVQVLSRFDRAVLNASVVDAGAMDFLSSKKKKELQRQLRRLREMGTVTFGEARDGAVLREQIEAFMALETKGWKGRQGGAFLNDAKHAAFLRAMTRNMGNQGQCRLYWLALNGRMIAGNIVLIAEGAAYFWKTAYDEDFSFASLGVQLTLDMTERLLREPAIKMADSCAVSDHPMIDHIWRARLPMTDVMVSLRRERVDGFSGALQRERLRRRLREKAKSVLAHFRFG